jgi:hypothetical protein
MISSTAKDIERWAMDVSAVGGHTVQSGVTDLSNLSRSLRLRLQRSGGGRGDRV